MSVLPVVLAYARAAARRFPDRERLERWQARRLDALLAEVLPRSRFYAERVGARRASAWHEVPPIDKATMMEVFDDLVTVDVRREDALRVALAAEASRDFAPMIGALTVGLSSGTSGHRGLFLVSPRERHLWAGTVLQRLLPGGLASARRDRVAFFLRANSNLYETVRSRRVSFDFFDLHVSIDAHRERLAALRPTVLVAPPSMLRLLADEPVQGLAPERVVSVAEVLDPVDEREIRRHFRVRIDQVYQATEGFLGSTCRFGTLHLAEDAVRIDREVVDAATGRFHPVVTDLFRTTQPILRYRLDDVVLPRAVPCLCGSPLLGVERVEGRADDVLWLPGADGPQPVFPDVVRHALLAVDGLRAYGVRQTAADRVELYIDPPHRHVAAAAVLGARLRDVGVTIPTLVSVHAWPGAGPTKVKRVVRACPVPR